MNNVFTIIFFISLWSQAENSSLRTLFNQIAKGQLSCLKVDTTDLSNIQTIGESSCNKIGNQLTTVHENSYQLFEKTLFDLAAEVQKKRAICLRDQVKDFFKDDNSSLVYMAPLIVNWMRWRQASLKLEKCNSMFFSRFDKNITTSSGKVVNAKTIKEKWSSIKAKDKIYRDSGAFLYQTLSEEELKTREDFCFDQKQINKLQEIKRLSEFSIPVFSSVEMFNIISNYPGVIKLKKNNSIVADGDLEQLETLNFRDIYIDINVLGFSMLNCSKSNDPNCLQKKNTKSLTNKIYEYLSEVSQNQVGISNEMINKKTAGIAFNENEKDYLFEIESVHEALAEVNELPGYLEGVSLKEVKVSNAVACLFDKFQKQLSMIKGLSINSSAQVVRTFNFLEFPVTAFLEGAILKKGIYESSFKALKGAGVINQPSVRLGLKRLKPFTSSSSGFLYEGVNYMYKELDKQCVSTVGMQNRTVPVNLVANELLKNIKGMSEDEIRGIYKKFVLQSIPNSCKKLKDTDLIQNNFYRSNCIEALVENLAPGKVAIPAFLLIESTINN